jgi:hypothetical protein
MGLQGCSCLYAGLNPKNKGSPSENVGYIQDVILTQVPQFIEIGNSLTDEAESLAQLFIYNSGLKSVPRSAVLIKIFRCLLLIS